MIDRRIRKTQAQLHRAIVSLVHEKDYDSIVVKQILDRANVSRSTFYSHFGDKDELLISTIRDILRSALATRPLSSSQRCQRLLWFSLPMLEYYEKHRRATGPHVRVRGTKTLHERLREVLVELVADEARKVTRPVPDSIPPDLLAQHIASTFILVLDWWIDSASSLSAAEVDTIFRTLIEQPREAHSP